MILLFFSLNSCQVAALLCVGNLVEILEVEDLGGLQTLHDLRISLSATAILPRGQFKIDGSHCFGSRFNIALL